MRRIFVLAVWMLLYSSASAFAAIVNSYGAIAYDRPTGSWGASYDHPSQQVANDSALRACGKHASGCAVVGEVLNFCGAYATGPGATAGWATNHDPVDAEQWALRKCNSLGGPCEVKAAVCNTPHMIYVPTQEEVDYCWSQRNLFKRSAPGCP